MHKLGYFYLSEGRSLTANIADYINKGRYSNNPDKSISPPIETINNVLSLTLPVTLTPEMWHVDLAHNFVCAISTRNIWVYDNGVLVSDKPFTTFSSAMQAIGYSPTRVAGRQTIDTGKAVGGQYTFYSFPALWAPLGVKYL
jgi:hypothetical protein